MEQKGKPTLYQSGGAADLAFAVVVLASYFATFSGLKEASVFNIALMAILGIAYILLGIYGYSYSARSNNLYWYLFYFAMQIPLGAMIVYLGKGAGFNAMVLVPLVGHAVVLLPVRWGYIVEVAIIAGYLVSVRAFSSSWIEVWAGFPVFFAALVFVAVFTQMAVDEEKARKEVERLLVELEELTITRERNRLAREIHDGLGHYLTTVHMQIQAAKAVMVNNPTKALEALEKAQSMAQEALLDVRQSVGALRASPSERQPLPEMISRLLKSCETPDLETDLKIIGVPRTLNQQTHLTLFRTTQEGVNNARKYAKASKLQVVINYSMQDTVKLTIMDNGVGAESLEGGFGLPGLRERINLLNGKLDIFTSPGKGLTLEVIVPE